jgi:hypothetical protein
MSQARFDWREHLPVHPAADLFPLMSEPELHELGEDIKANGLRSKIIIYSGQLLDGRNRLDAMAMVGFEFRIDHHGAVFVKTPSGDISVSDVAAALDNDGVDPDAYIISANIHRRHLTSEQKRELITKLLKAKPEASDRQIAKQTNSSPTTVGAVRKEKEASGDVSKLDTRKDSKGRKQPARKPKAAKPEPQTESKTKPEIGSPDLGTSIAERKAGVEAMLQAEQATVQPEPAPAAEPKPDPTNFEKVKERVAKLEQQWTDLEIEQWNINAQQGALVEQANLTPAQAREIKQLFDELERKRDDILEKHPLSTQETAFDIASRLVRQDDDRKRFIKQAASPQKALKRDREQEQRDEMECDRDDARQQARESGESWSEVKDEWEADWIQDNWTEEREKEFLDRFKDEWQRNHRQKFPNSDFAPTPKAVKVA